MNFQGEENSTISPFKWWLISVTKWQSMKISLAIQAEMNHPIKLNWLPGNYQQDYILMQHALDFLGFTRHPELGSMDKWGCGSPVRKGGSALCVFVLYGIWIWHKNTRAVSFENSVNSLRNLEKSQANYSTTRKAFWLHWHHFPPSNKVSSPFLFYIHPCWHSFLIGLLTHINTIGASAMTPTQQE